MSDLGKTHYIAVTCIIVKDEKFLITKRAPHEKHFPNRWTVPGGKLEADDYQSRKLDTDNAWYNVLENLAKREIFEETGLKVKDMGYVTSLVFMRPDGIPTLVISLYAHYDSGEVKLDSSMSDYTWVGVNEAKNYEFISGIYEEIQMVDKILKGEKIGEWEK